MQPSSGGRCIQRGMSRHVYCTPPPPTWHPPPPILHSPPPLGHPTPSMWQALFAARVGRKMVPPICLSSFNNRSLCLNWWLIQPDHWVLLFKGDVSWIGSNYPALSCQHFILVLLLGLFVHLLIALWPDIWLAVHHALERSRVHQE